MRFPDFNDDWTQTTLGEILSIGSGRDYKHLSKGDIPVFGTGGYMTSVDQFLMNGESVFIGRKGTIDKPFYYNGEFWTVDTLFYTHSFVNSYPRFVLYLFSNINWLEYNEASGVPSLSKTTISKIPICLPQLAEQKKIADFLSLIDERINNLSETLRELKNQKAALLNQLFSQKLRFPDFDNEWTQTTLGEIAERVTRKNNGHVTSRPLTISAQYGLIDQRDFFNKIVASTSLEGYYLLNKGEFAYNRSSSADYPWGAIKRLESYENGALSTLYICFSLLQGYPSFIAHFFETSQWHEYIQSIAAEGARNHGLLNISVSDFFALPISLPTLEEQKKIADFLSLIDERIEVEEQLLKKYEEQKKYLLRNMFV